MIGIERPKIHSEKRQWLSWTFAKGRIEEKQVVTATEDINNVQRSVGARMAGWLAERFGNYRLDAGLLNYTYRGIAAELRGLYGTRDAVKTNR